MFYIYFEDKRHATAANPKRESQGAEWRIKDRQRTVSAAIMLCLNIGVDPPDVVKPQPCAKLEAWIDPTTSNDPKKTIEQIGKQLQSQYEALSTRTKYKQSLDPSVEDAKRLCVNLRRNAREERILFHYNGHGVPRPTPSGEIWVFNRGYTQYIPVSVYDLQTWLGAPCIYLYDCHAAGHIVENFNKFVNQREEAEKKGATQPNGNFKPAVPNGQPDPNSAAGAAAAAAPTYSAAAFRNCIQLAACRADESLPMHPDLPADLFTCCITSPIDIAVRWFVLQNPMLRKQFDIQDLEQLTIPGKVTDRRTPLGELNWIFTAITDTIAWSSLPSPIFKRLFRQDLVVAAMFRNFLLAVRIMRVHNCHPVSYPELPDTHAHPMWEAWDLAMDHCLVQLPQLKAAAKPGGQPYVYKHSDFFEQQLTAFDLWLKYRPSSDLSKPPGQLPVLLQVLLSQIHRLRALVLLSRYLDLGPQPVNQALSIGIFPYVLKLLQSPSPELKPVLVFIWARIMAVDYRNIQHELVRENGFEYFINILMPDRETGVYQINTVNLQEHLAMCAFVTALFCRGFRQGQRLCLGTDIIETCLQHTQDLESPLLRQWACLCLCQLWEGDFIEAKNFARKEHVVERLSLTSLKDSVPEVRAACIYALMTYLDGQPSAVEPEAGEEAEKIRELHNLLTMRVLALNGDASSVVRREVICYLAKYVKLYMGSFLVVAFVMLESEFIRLQHVNTGGDDNILNSPYMAAWHALLILCQDPFKEVATYAQRVVDYVYRNMERTPLAEEAKRLGLNLMENMPSDAPFSDTNSPQYQLWSSLSALDINAGNGTYTTGGNGDESPKLGRGSPCTRTMSSYSKRESSSPSRGSSITMTAGLGSPSNGSGSGGGMGTLRRSVSYASTALRNMATWAGETNSVGSMGSDGRKQHVDRLPSEADLRSYSHHSPSQYSHNDSGRRAKYGASIKPPSVGAKFSYATENMQELPESVFFEWACEYFQGPQMSNSEADEPGSVEYMERVWKKGRNEKIMAETQSEKELAIRGNWNAQVAFFDNETQASRFTIAQFEDHLVAADTADVVTIWDWKRGARLNRFSNGNPRAERTKITELKFLNEDDHPLLLTGSSDGIVKIYRHYESAKDVEVVCAWRALSFENNQSLLSPSSWNSHSSSPDLVSASSNQQQHASYLTNNLVAEWQQSRGTLLVSGGNSRVIKIWDAPRELCVSDIRARSGHAITALSSDQVAGNIMIGGFSDGAVRVYDRRLDPHQALIQTWKLHETGIVNCRMQRGGARELVTASSDGKVALWDIRMTDPVQTYQGHSRGIRSMDVHEHAPVIATGSQTVSVWSTDGSRVSTVRPPTTGYVLSNRIAPISYVTFHPHHMILAVNSTQDSHISVYKCQDS